jgi:hypothetical protein
LLTGQRAACASAFLADSDAASTTMFFIAFCSLSKARTSIWRTRSRLMPYFDDRSSSVLGSSTRRRSKHVLALAELLALAEAGFLVGRVVDQPVLPFHVAFGFHGGVQRAVRRGEAAVHVHHLLLGHAEAGGDLGDLLGAEIALLDRLHLALELAQVEEQLLLRRRGAHLHQRPAMEDVLLDRGADPPHGIGGQPEAAVGVEPLHRLHHADVALGDQLGHRQAVAAIAHGDLGDEAQMRRHQLVCGLGIPMFPPALR